MNSGNRAKKPLRSRILIFSLTLGIAILIASAYVGIKLYLAFSTVPVCDLAPVQSKNSLRTFNPSDASSAGLLGDHSLLACPEAVGGFFEWYITVIHLDDYILETVLWVRGINKGWSIAGVSVRDAKTMKPLSVDIEKGSWATWAEKGCDAGMITTGPDGERGRSYIYLVRDGPDAGSFELRILTPKKDLHVYMRPVGPGLVSDGVWQDGTRPGSWWQYTVPVMLGEVRGFLIDYSGDEKKVYEFPGPEAKKPHGFLEHMWGQADQDNFYWDWGEFEDLDQEAALFFAQVEDTSGKIRSMAAVSKGRDLPIKLNHDPQGDLARVAYSRFHLHDGLYYPQQIHVWGLSRNPPATMSMTGFLQGFYPDWMSFTLYGSAETEETIIDWRSSPVSSEVQFFKGAMPRLKLPPAPQSIIKDCTDTGCRLALTMAGSCEGEVEYWVFRSDDGSRSGREKPAGMASYSCDQPKGSQPLKINDPLGTEDSIYMVVPVSVPESLLHNRYIAGYPKCTSLPEMADNTEAVPDRLVTVLNRGTAMAFAGPDRTAVSFNKGGTGGRGSIIFERGLTSGNSGFVLKEGDRGEGKPLPLVFAPDVQVQSFHAVDFGPRSLALAWSERCPIMGSEGSYTDWDVFIAIISTLTHDFMVSPVSMSMEDSVDVSMEADNESLTIKWRECGKGKCRKAREEVYAP